MAKTLLWKHSIAFVALIITLSSLIILIVSHLKLPEISTTARKLRINPEPRKPQDLGKFGEMMIGMLPQDLAFTVFVPTELAFARDLGLKSKHNESNSVDENVDDDDNTVAVVSRVLGFSVVPRPIYSRNAGMDDKCFDSLCGFRVCVWVDSDGVLMVNGVRGERVDLERKKIVVHLIDGVIMDAEFQQSIDIDVDAGGEGDGNGDGGEGLH